MQATRCVIYHLEGEPTSFRERRVNTAAQDPFPWKVWRVFATDVLRHSSVQGQKLTVSANRRVAEYPDRLDSANVAFIVLIAVYWLRDTQEQRFEH